MFDIDKFFMLFLQYIKNSKGIPGLKVGFSLLMKLLCKMDNMTELEIEEYSQQLANRRSEAKILPRAEIIGGDWQPEANKCHHNATT